ncbi:methyltransferase [Thiohalocapsa sp. ML1]|jgi:SAM-dependent methyltransferase|uniref:methyltransferase n=1 Tax=Thiohalocapsa sp. ML1 TaxID=1431688 RepID=UPI0009E9A29F|nr:methyltransferase [Thiohalocapsa sp. ML1]
MLVDVLALTACLQPSSKRFYCHFVSLLALLPRRQEVIVVTTSTVDFFSLELPDGGLLELAADFSKVYRPTRYARRFVEILSEQPLDRCNVLDVGCGSGIIGIFAAMKGATVTCCDLNQYAVECAVSNAARLGLRVAGVVSDGLDEFAKRRDFDLVVCNPPSSPGQVSPEITPRDNGELGRFLLDSVLAGAPRILAPNGRLLTCSNSEQDWSTTEGTLAANWAGYRIVADVDESFNGLAQFPPSQLDAWVRSGVCWLENGEVMHNVRYLFAYR